MLTNFLPAVSGDDPAVWRRILVVPFDVTIPEHDRDPGLPDRLKRAAPAILAWVQHGWRDYQAQGLNPPEAVRMRTAAYQAASDALARFLDERAIITPHGAVRARDLFTAWSRWCHDNGETPGERGHVRRLDGQARTREEEAQRRTVLPRLDARRNR
ncbi:hypothetical protein [Streptomyces natalensis]|uniref:hypothetical protein n=1 Tax=Streptomyces natalensis TaxID=68242 RepID=UPI00069155ED|nr:hypothetical protein [Streptomyces natalensis]